MTDGPGQGGAFTHDGTGTSPTEWAAAAEWDAVPELDLLGRARPRRVVVAAAHPDDESLGAGGLVARLHRDGIPASLVVATAGERSHPRSPTVPPEAMGRRRRAEAVSAWAALGGTADDVDVWGLPDGGLAACEDDLVTRLVAVLGDARDTLLVTPWRLDGHPDHDALGRAGRRAAYRTGARHVQFPVWFWHHAIPADAPWSTMVRLRLSDGDREAKALAVAAHHTQVAPLSAEPGDETLLSPSLLAHFTGSSEAFVIEPPDDTALDEVHVEHEDPWGTETRWYEQRKRELVLATLPRGRFRRALDVGCSTGTLTEAVARRCHEIVAVDRSATAVGAARRRLAGSAGAEVRRLDLPWAWPEGRFDLVLCSEVGYFLSPAGLDELVERVAGSLTDDGCLVLAHWRHEVVGWPLSGPAVHARFERHGGTPPVVARYVDRDVEIVVHGPPGVLPDPDR